VEDAVPEHQDNREAVIARARSFLFVPGDRADRFDKAVGSGADIVILDLEDAVAADRKDSARDFVRQWLDRGNRALVRLNGADTQWFSDDSQLCGHPSLIGAMLPKAEPGVVLERVTAVCPIVALVETARGIRRLDDIALTSGVVRLAFGSVDLALDLGFTGPDAALDPLRLELVTASRAAGIAPPIGGVTTDFRDPTQVRSDMQREAALGFSAKLCIHPAQVEPIHEGLRPDSSELEQARRIVAAFDAAEGAAAAFEGKMIDKPVVESARRLLAAAGLKS
jgi:citrate lyase subunit beta/citryl-CoA lyase